jgi:hypothetical protein
VACGALLNLEATNSYKFDYIGIRAGVSIWAYLEPCDIRRFPSITRFQAMTLGNLKSMAEMSQWEWKQTTSRSRSACRDSGVSPGYVPAGEEHQVENVIDGGCLR